MYSFDIFTKQNFTILKILKITKEKWRIWIQIRSSVVRIHGSGSRAPVYNFVTPHWEYTGTLHGGPFYFSSSLLLSKEFLQAAMSRLEPRTFLTAAGRHANNLATLFALKWMLPVGWSCCRDWVTKAPTASCSSLIFCVSCWQLSLVNAVSCPVVFSNLAASYKQQFNEVKL